MKWFFTLFVIIFSALFFSACNPLDYKAASGLQIITGETPSSVFINGQYLNKTPLVEKSLKPGPYHVLIQPDDSEYVPYETDVILRNGLLTVITWKPERRPELSSGVILELQELDDKTATKISFVTIPDGAIITIDGRKEFSPVSLSDVKPGIHEFEVTLPSYETQRHKVDVQAGYEMKATVKLAKLQQVSGEAASSSARATATPRATPSPVTGSSAITAPNASVIPTPTPTPTTVLGAAIVQGTVTILKTGYRENGKEVLRVRETPSNSGKELGFVAVGSKQPYTGEKKNGWYKISFNGGYGWVNGAYAQLDEKK